MCIKHYSHLKHDTLEIYLKDLKIPNVQKKIWFYTAGRYISSVETGPRMKKSFISEYSATVQWTKTSFH